MKRICIAAVAVSVLAWGCGAKDETVVVGPDGTRATVSKDGKDVTVKGDNGAEYSTNDGGKTATFKDDKGNSTNLAFTVSEADLGVPFYSGSADVPNGSTNMDVNGAKTVMCQRTTQDDPEKVIAFYKDKVEGGETSNSAIGETKMAALAKGKTKDGAEINITAMKQKTEVTHITITVQHPKK